MHAVPMAPSTIALKLNKRIVTGNPPAAFALRAAGPHKGPWPFMAPAIAPATAAVRTAIHVDGFNFYYWLKPSPFRWINWVYWCAATHVWLACAKHRTSR
jgi:hypothetical protein